MHENIIDIQFAVQYFLSDPPITCSITACPTRTSARLRETAIAKWSEKQDGLCAVRGREQVAPAATKLMQEILDRYKSGILISKLTMQNAQPPEQVQAAFDDAVKAGQDRDGKK